MTPSRRSFLKSASALAVSPAFAQQTKTPAPSRIRLAVSTYSYWHLRGEKYPIEKAIDEAARLGFDGVEILHRQMTDESPAYVRGLKQRAFRNGLTLPMLSIHQDFVFPDAA